MDLRKLKTLIDLVAESGIAELEVTEGEDKVRIVKTHAGAAHAWLHGPVTYAAPMQAAAHDASASDAERAGGAARTCRQVADGGHFLSIAESGCAAVHRAGVGGQGRATRSASSKR